MDNSNIVWTTRLDEKYDIRVERSNSYKGELIIELNGKELLRETVNISYDAMFGPDVSDVLSWQDRCCNFVDGLTKK